MAGLLSGMAPQGGMPGAPQQAAAPPSSSPAAPPPQDGPITEQEQQTYDLFVKNALRVIYDPQALPEVLNVLDGDGEPVAGLANAAAAIVMRVEDSANEAGMEVPPDVLLQGGAEILSDLANLAEEAGIHAFSDEEVEAATYQALDQYRTTRQQQGRLQPEPFMADLERMIQADQAGHLDQVLPGAGAAAKHFDKIGAGGMGEGGMDEDRRSQPQQARR